MPADPNMKILVVDDNYENRALARATLEDEGHDVVLAASGEEGIAAFEAELMQAITSSRPSLVSPYFSSFIIAGIADAAWRK